MQQWPTALNTTQRAQKRTLTHTHTQKLQLGSCWRKPSTPTCSYCENDAGQTRKIIKTDSQQHSSESLQPSAAQVHARHKSQRVMFTLNTLKFPLKTAKIAKWKRPWSHLRILTNPWTPKSPQTSYTAREERLIGPRGYPTVHHTGSESWEAKRLLAGRLQIPQTDIREPVHSRSDFTGLCSSSTTAGIELHQFQGHKKSIYIFFPTNQLSAWNWLWMDSMKKTSLVFWYLVTLLVTTLLFSLYKCYFFTWCATWGKLKSRTRHHRDLFSPTDVCLAI